MVPKVAKYICVVYCPHPLNLIRSLPHLFNHFEIQFAWKFAGKLRKTTANNSQKRRV